MFRRVPRLLIRTVIVLTVSLGIGVLPVAADTVQSGERTLGQSTIEPAYNDADGSAIYLLTPDKAPVHGNLHNTAPLYVIMYPSWAAATIGTVNCAHQPADNCPDHGPLLAGLAEGAEPSVYGDGVWGHDHMLAAPGSGGDFNFAWLPIAVLFTTPSAVTHITTLAELRAVEATQTVPGTPDAIEIPLPPATFNCAVVSGATYNHGTPVPTVPAVP